MTKHPGVLVTYCVLRGPSLMVKMSLSDYRPGSVVETAFDLISAAGARALGIADYGIMVGGAANLCTIPTSGIPEAVAAHPPRRLVLFEGQIVARDGVVLPAPAPIA